MLFDDISARIEHNATSFFTELEAYKAGYIDDPLYTDFNPHSLIGHLSVQRPHLIEKVIPYTGKITYKLPNVDIKYNIHLYDESLIIDDITVESADFYLEHIDKLSPLATMKLYSILKPSNISTIQRLKLRIPIMYINNDIKLVYSVYMKDLPDYLDYLLALNDPGFVFDNLSHLRNNVTEAYILKNVTDVNAGSVKALLRYGFTMEKILMFKPEAVEYAVESIEHVGDIPMLIKAINKNTPVYVMDKLIKEFPEYSQMINDLMKDKINSLMKN